MFISTIIPTRHRNTSLAACLERLAPSTQTLPVDQYEVIVADDGVLSTAEAMVRDRFPWARWIEGPRRGPAANRNRGASVARGEWFAFTDDDCLPLPGWLSAYAEVVAAGGGPILEGRTTCEAGIRSILEQAPVNLTGGNLWSCNMMLARTAFITVGGFDERFPHAAVEDLEFHDRLRRTRQHIQFVSGAVIDHPPRRRLLGYRAAALWEGRMLLQQLEPKSLREWLPLHVAKVQFSQLLQWPLTIASARFAWSMLVEVTAVVLYARVWSTRYAGAVPLDPRSTQFGPAVGSSHG